MRIYPQARARIVLGDWCAAGQGSVPQNRPCGAPGAYWENRRSRPTRWSAPPARGDLGIAALPRYVAEDSLASGHIVELLKDHALPEQEIPAVFPGQGPGLCCVPAGLVW